MKYIKLFDSLSALNTFKQTDDFISPNVSLVENEDDVYYNPLIIINPSVTMGDWTYGETASNPVVSGNTGNGTVTYMYKVSTADDNTYTSTKPSEIGTYTVKATIMAKGQYSAGSCTTTFTINKASINPSVSISDWTYGNNASIPSVSDNTDNGSVTYTYSSDNSTWSSTQPTNAGSYYIKATIDATSNYNGAICTATFTISKANINPSVTMSDWNEGETASNPVISGNTGNGNVNYMYKVSTADDNTYTSTKPSNAGTYTVKATIDATTNYNGAICTYDFEIISSNNYSQNYLTIESLENSNIISWKAYSNSLTKTISVSTDNGSTWTDKTSDTTGVTLATLNTGDKLLVKGSNTVYANSDYHNYFVSTGEFNVEGNIMSMIYGDNFIGQTTLNSAGHNFERLFKICIKLISAENLILPTTTLANNCYDGMFVGCTSLTTAPELPATTLANYCYDFMFKGCTSLTTAPELPVTTLANNCYSNMFSGCTSLTTAPELPATTLADYCYNNMFASCTSLTTAPELPATTLADYCYNRMFQDCTSLNYAKCLATDISASYCTNNWLNNVASTGTFVKNANMTSWSTGASGIPSGWTIQDAA